MTKQYPIELFESKQDHVDVVAPPLMKPANFRRKSNLLGVAVLAIVIPGLFATVALPAYGATSPESTAEAQSNAELQQEIKADAQTTFVNAAADGVTVRRDTVKFVAPRPVVAHYRFTGLVQSYGNISITGVAAIAARYIGVPYVFGGESPSGFDCSGLVEYVYAQIGIQLPHSSRAQGQMGTRVPISRAKSGDIVVMDGGSHVGIYVGGGHMIDAPYPGRVVSVDKIYDNNYWIVHL